MAVGTGVVSGGLPGVAVFSGVEVSDEGAVGVSVVDREGATAAARPSAEKDRAGEIKAAALGATRLIATNPRSSRRLNAASLRASERLELEARPR